MTAQAIDNLRNPVVESTTGEAPSPAENVSRSRRWLEPAVYVGLLILVLACFFRTLKEGYFLADDFGEFGYIDKIVHGRWDLFVANWTGNYMQIPSMAVYRPWQLMSLLSCYLIGKANPVPWYAANVLFYYGNAVMIFLVCKQLTRKWDYWRSLTAGALAATLFVVNPMHCESVSWVVGRVDIECSFYMLAAVWCFIRYLEQRKKWQLGVSLLCFWLGMLVKEMAIGFPVIATTLSFLAADRPADTVSLKQRVKRTVAECCPVWASTGIYFLVRYLALGTFTGGYIGTIGNGQSVSAIQRWIDPDNWHRFFLPFAVSLFPAENIWKTLLSGCYAALIAIFAVKALRKELPWRLALLCLVWFVSAALPIYKLWGIGLDLEGSRFCYFMTVALSMSAAMLVMAPGEMKSGLGNKATAVVGAVVLLLCTAALYKTCIRTNSVWVHASREVKAILHKAYDLAIVTQGKNENSSVAHALPEVNVQGGPALLILGIPKNNAGAHMIYNGVTFRLGLMQPVAKTDVSERFINFDPLFYGHDEYINSARFKRCLAIAGAQGPYVWNSDKLEFANGKLTGYAEPGAPLNLSAAGESASVQAFADGHSTVQVNGGTYTFTNNQIGDGLQFNNLNLDPRQYDFLQFEYAMPADASGARAVPAVFRAKWSGSEAQASNPSLNTATITSTGAETFSSIRIPVSHYWRWYASGKIRSVALVVPPIQGIRVRNVVLLSDANLRPKLTCQKIASDVSGVFVTGDSTQFSIDAASIPGAAQLSLEATKPDYFFDQLDGNIVDGLNATAILPGNKYVGSLPKRVVPALRYCEVRVRALDASGKPLAEYSEPIILYKANQATIPSLW